MAPKTHTYEELDTVPIPRDIPELGIGAGRVGVVDFTYDGGRGLHVEVSRKDGSTAGFVQIELGEDEAGDLWRVVSYTPIGSTQT